MRQLILGVLLMVIGPGANASPAEEGFVDLEVYIPGIVVEARYAGDENFMGRPVQGYHAGKAFMSREAAEKLTVIQKRLSDCGLTLKVFDAYRPQRAVDDFMAWTKDTGDTLGKARYYPDVAKDDLVPHGYIAEKSGHTRGSTIDLTIAAHGEDGRLFELDMGSPWDFFGPVSHALSKEVSMQQRANRMLLRSLMTDHGFKPYEAEWWHFTLADEPYPDTYFDFPVE
ncbi:M15 family metallopeptidase [Kordiimonas aestuarii]|uniref:M15 family metallopeptidase n=1 Tax=Kordiimonas aestuarii TaxID=1005925 RepID=UPI0021CF9446|nr:M15 family metallopeptidase [Kordiimonas aestuarii]